MSEGVVYPLGVFDPKELNLALPGNLTVAGTVTASGVSYNNNITATTSTALTVTRDAGNYYGLQVDESTASAATGLYIKARAAASGLALSVLSSGGNEALTLDAKGLGTITVGSVSTGNVVLGTAGHTLTLNNGTGATTIAAGGLTVTAGGIAVTAGNITVAAAAGLDTGAPGALEIGQSNATSVVIGMKTTIAAGANGNVGLVVASGAAPSVDILDVKQNATTVFAVDKTGHIVCTSIGTPATSALNGGLTSATPAGCDVAGTITIVENGGQAAGNICTMTFATPYAVAPKAVQLAPANATAAVGWSTILPWASSIGTNSWVLTFAGAGTAAATYVLSYEVTG
jgi:hypothetical protein